MMLCTDSELMMQEFNFCLSFWLLQGTVLTVHFMMLQTNSELIMREFHFMAAARYGVDCSSYDAVYQQWAYDASVYSAAKTVCGVRQEWDPPCNDSVHD